MSGNSGPAVPSEPSYKGYTQPANWVSPAVSGQNLMVHTGTLRNVGSALSEMAGKLQQALSNWQLMTQAAAAGTGSWQAAKALAHTMDTAYTGVQQFTSDLQKAHSDMATRLGISAGRYEDNEAALAALATRSTASGSTVVGAGGNNTPVDPTPAQARVLDLEHHMEQAGDNENWQSTFPITEDASFSSGSTSGYSWQQVKTLLDGTDPGAIINAGAAYHALSDALGTAANQLAAQGGQLSGDWGGPTAVTAVSQVQQLWQTAADLQANTYSAGASLAWYGPVLAAFKANPPTASTPNVTRGAHQSAASYQAAVTSANNAANNAADQQAQQYLAQLNGHMQTAFSNMPPTVNKNLPPPLASTGGNLGSPTLTGGGGGLSGGTGGVGGVSGGSGGSSPTVGSPPHGTTPPVGTPPGGTTPPVGTPPGGTSPVGPLPVGSTPPGYHLSGGTAPIGVTSPGGPGGPGPVSTLPPPGGGGSPGPVGVLPPPGGSTGPGGPGGVDPVPGGGTGPGGVDPVPGGGTGPGGVDPIPGGGTGPGGLLTGEPGPDGVSPVGLDPEPGVGTPGIGPDGVITGPGGAVGAAGDDLAASGGALGGEAGGQGMMPMMGMPGGGGVGQGGLDRMRESWSSEDEGTWGQDTAFGGAADGADATSDGMFPGMMPLGGTSSSRQDRDRFRQAWMDEDEDVWGTGQPAVPPVISPN
jgi:hypothetical protein